MGIEEKLSEKVKAEIAKQASYRMACVIGEEDEDNQFLCHHGDPEGFTIAGKKVFFVDDCLCTFVKDYLGSRFIFDKTGNLKKKEEILEEMISVYAAAENHYTLTKVMKYTEADSIEELVECLRIDATVQILKKLGKGADGETFKARDREDTDSYKALKIISRENVNPNEAKSLERSVHKNIVKVHLANDRFVKKNGEPVFGILMEYVDGKTLREILDDTSHRVDFHSALNYSSQLLEGIAYLQQRKRFHNDIHPNNMKINSSGVLKILDFGIATQDYQTKPEGKNRKYGGDNDLFSWGLITYEMLVGEHFIYKRGEGMGTETFAKEIRILKGLMRNDEGRLKPAYQDKINNDVPESLQQPLLWALENTVENDEVSFSDFQATVNSAVVQSYRERNLIDIKSGSYYQQTREAFELVEDPIIAAALAEEVVRKKMESGGYKKLEQILEKIRPALSTEEYVALVDVVAKGLGDDKK